jgi:phosphohistidine phosphatase
MTPARKSRTRTPSRQRPSKPHTLYLVRHAIAAERGPKYPDDNLRPLTKEGIDKMRTAARGLADLDPEIDVVISSPLVRAKQTAEILLGELEPTPAHGLLEELSPGYSPADLAEALGRYETHRTIALVGHEPDLGTFAAWLIGAHKAIPFKKGGIACFEVTAFPPTRSSTLLWAATPRMLRGLS